MNTKFLRIIMAICLILPCVFMASACDDGLTDCAYVRFIPAVDGEVVLYNSSDMYAVNGDHIYLYENEAKKNEKSFSSNLNYLLKIKFKRVYGELQDQTESTLVVNIETWYSMDISVRKDYYNNTADNTPKKVYLNGVDITSKADATISKPPIENASASLWYDGLYYFEDFGFVKGNKSNFINTIEFK